MSTPELGNKVDRYELWLSYKSHRSFCFGKIFFFFFLQKTNCWRRRKRFYFKFLDFFSFYFLANFHIWLLYFAFWCIFFGKKKQFCNKLQLFIHQIKVKKKNTTHIWLFVCVEHRWYKQKAKKKLQYINSNTFNKSVLLFLFSFFQRKRIAGESNRRGIWMGFLMFFFFWKKNIKSTAKKKKKKSILITLSRGIC